MISASKSFTPSPQQANIFTWVVEGTGSGIVNAVAGAGKTTTLLHSLRLMLDTSEGSIALAAYNTKIAAEILTKAMKMFSADEMRRISIKTFHGFGFAAIRYATKSNRTPIKTDADKVQNICDQLFVPVPYLSFVRKAVALAKQVGIGIVTKETDPQAWLDMVDHYDLTEELVEHYGDDAGNHVKPACQVALKVLRESNRIWSQVIDFDDMIYIPILMRLRVWQNKWVLIDEAQDTNVVRRMLARMMLDTRRGGRLIAVGDENQAIYGFTGADSEALRNIKTDFGAVDLDLTVTYRCPKSVVAYVKQFGSFPIEAHESAPEGTVASISSTEMMKMDLTPADAILCRNTKPLVDMAYSLLRKGVACHVEGRDIGASLLKLVNRWKVATLPALVSKIETWRTKEVAKAEAARKPQKAEAISDRADTILTIIEGLLSKGPATVADLRAWIVSMFQDADNEAKPTLTLCTGHRSKGREWKRVFWYGRAQYQPSKFARQEWQIRQEINLMYVMGTRSMSELYEVS